MRLTQQPAPETSPHDLTARAFDALDRRLLAVKAAPVCVAVSGGGDSMVLLALACDWGRERGRPVLALSVDHRLQPDSAAWSRLAAETARRLGARAEVLCWQGEKPSTGLSAAARQARHRLMAEAARSAGAGVILLAHTADDLDEAELMRAQGSNLGAAREWAPSPAWPEGRDVFLLRPLLGERRRDLRAFLRGRGIDWIEDPANADLKSARARARQALRSHQPARVPTCARGVETEMRALFEAVREEGGGLVLSRAALRAAERSVARRLLAAALLSAAGTSRPPRGTGLDALMDRLAAPGPVAATLAGARIQASPDEIFVMREMPRGGLPPFLIRPGAVSVWDGRFEISGVARPRQVVPAAGRMARLSARDRKEILGLPPTFRGSQPVLTPLKAAGGETRPDLASSVARVRALAGPRLRAACGLIAHEGDIDAGRVAPEGRSSYVGLERPVEAAGI